jgi:hypothetical protein
MRSIAIASAEGRAGAAPDARAGGHSTCGVAVGPPGRDRLGVPPSTFADEIVSTGLESWMEMREVASRVLARMPSVELVVRVASEKDAAVCLSALDARIGAIRQRLRQLRGSMPDRKVVIGYRGRTPAALADAAPRTGRL